MPTRVIIIINNEFLIAGEDIPGEKELKQNEDIRGSSGDFARSSSHFPTDQSDQPMSLSNLVSFVT